MFLLQSGDESLLVDDLAPRDVRDVGALWVGLMQELKFLGGEEMRCRFPSSCVSEKSSNRLPYMTWASYLR